LKKILIIGGGFAGLSCARRLAGYGKGLEITLIDKKTEFDFLPLLPDTIGRGISPDCLAFSLDRFGREAGFNYICQEALEVDLSNKVVFTKAGRMTYDYLVIASGSQTNFYGNQNIEKSAYKLDGAADARNIREIIVKNKFQQYIVSGGGYTGIELAANLSRYLNKRDGSAGVIIVERAPGILGSLPQWMKDYVLVNLKRLKIEVLTASAIESIHDRRVVLSGGRVIDDAVVFWAAGVRAADFVQKLNLEKNPQGRIQVDGSLAVNQSCFVCGDASYFAWKNNFLRMSVQFAIDQGNCVGVNILNSLNAKPLVKFLPRDPGFIIPMANNRSCGNIWGINFKGRLPTLMHFMMCIYRSCGIKNKLGVIKGLVNNF